MELTKHTIDELKDVVNDSKMCVNEATVNKVLSIFNDDLLFSGTLKWQKREQNIPFSTRTDEKSIKYNLNIMKKKVKRLHERQPLFDLTLEDYYFFYLIYSLFHEISHLERYIKSTNNEMEYAYLNYIYYLALETCSSVGVFGYLRYHYYHERYFYERNAEIEASKLMMDLADDNNLFLYAETSYINHLFVNSYTMNKGQVISPVEFTFKKLHFPISEVKEQIPFDIAFEQGLSITPEEYHYLYDYVLNKAKLGENLDVDVIYGRIKELTLKRENMSNEE